MFRHSGAGRVSAEYVFTLSICVAGSTCAKLLPVTSNFLGPMPTLSRITPDTCESGRGADGWESGLGASAGLLVAQLETASQETTHRASRLLGNHRRP
jgi:hypothetical protein